MATALAAAGALVLSAGLVGLAASPASADKPENPGKPSVPGKPAVGGGGGTHDEPPGLNRVGICHRTAAESNRYIFIEVPEAEANGHVTGTHQQHNRQVLWPTDGEWRGVPHQAGDPVEDYLASGPADCQDTSSGDDELEPTGFGTDDPCDPGNLRLIDTDPNFDYVVDGDVVRAVVVVSTEGKKIVGTQEWPAPKEKNLDACPGGDPDDITVAVNFLDPDCDNLDAASWTGTMNAIVDYTVTGKPGLGQSVTVSAAIEPAQAGKFQFKEGAKTSFSHTYPSVDELDCVLGEETIVPNPKPDKKPTKAAEEPTVKGVQVVVPKEAAPRAAAPKAAVPTAVAAGVGEPIASTATQLMAQVLVAGGLLLLLAGGWIGFGRREGGAHEA